MTYAPPTISAAGLSIPSYEDILEDNLAQYLTIFGANQYIGTDSAIYQLISILSLKQSDCCQGLQFAYNQSSPTTAVGAGLDRLGKLNGIARLPYSYSTCPVTLTGTPGTIIVNGAAQDANGNLWLIPTPTQIPSGGSITVTAQCAVAGNVTAGTGTITTIATPTGGWTGVTNGSPATPGNPVETDSQFRARQAISVAIPSLTRLAGTVAAIAETPGVTRYNVLENPTGSVDSYGNPAHSVTAVVEGGTNLAVATAIYQNRGIGCYTNGTTTVAVTDPNTGYVMNINFDRPTYVPIYVSLTVHGLNASFTTAVQTAIQTAIVNYLNSLQIGEIVTQSALYAIAMSVTASLEVPSYSIHALTLGTAPSPVGTTDITMLFYQVASGATANVVLTIV